MGTPTPGTERELSRVHAAGDDDRFGLDRTVVRQDARAAPANDDEVFDAHALREPDAPPRPVPRLNESEGQSVWPR